MSERKKLVFRLNDHGQGPELLRQVFLERGWQEFDEDDQEEHDWNIWWRSSRFRNSDYEQLMPWQRLNHHPKCTAITKKDSLARNLKRMKGVYGSSAYNFSPVAFNLPNDYTKFVAEYTRLKEKDPERTLYWICKPADLSRGRGIFIFRELSELQYDCNAVVQQYVTNPLLISGYKFDLRIYVMVPSFHPLNIYIYSEGLVRFSTEKFDLSKTNNMFSHLTNTSINKHSPSYTLDKERVGPGCKWTLTQLRSYLRQSNIDDRVLFGRIINIVVLTVIMQAHQAPQCNNCFEVYGFDIIIDEHLKPWLLEVNFSPSLSSDCQVDILVKKPMVHDLLDMLKFTEKDKERGGRHYRPSQQSSGVNLPVNWSHFDSSYRPHPPSNVHRVNPAKLPEIPQRSTNAGVGGGGHRIAAQDVEEEMVPIVPGCGLPSVQQPRLLSPASSLSSECSSVSSGTSGGQRSEHGHWQHASRRASVPQHNKSYNPVLVAMDTSRNHKASKLYKQSTLSDSAISSYSGSSDNSEQAMEKGHHNKQALKSSLLPSNMANTISRFDGSNPMKKLTFLSPISSESDGIVFPSSSYKTDTSSSVTKARLSLLNSPSRQPANKKSKMQTPLSKQRSSSLGALASNTLTTHTAQLNKRASQEVLNHSPKAFHGQTYDKLWRITKPLDGGSSYRKPNTGTPQRYGNYILAFPFNEVTRKCCHGNLDAKIIVQECQKLLKERMVDPSKERKLDEGTGRVPKVSDTPLLWGTLKEEVT